VFKKGILSEVKAGDEDAYRCLSCNTLCEVCADVCPNRANVVVVSGGKRQIVHVDQMCNECGNCASFCPHSGKPYKDKFTLFSTEEDFNNSENQGALIVNGVKTKVRMKDGEDKARFDALVEAAKSLEVKA